MNTKTIAYFCVLCYGKPELAFADLNDGMACVTLYIEFLVGVSLPIKCSLILILLGVMSLCSTVVRMFYVYLKGTYTILPNRCMLAKYIL